MKICPSPIMSVIHTINIDTMPNFNGGNNVHGLKNNTCKQTLTVVDLPSNILDARSMVQFSTFPCSFWQILTK